MEREPRLAANEAGGASGREPAVAVNVRAADVLGGLCNPAMVDHWWALDCREMTVAEWWAASRRGDLMACCLPGGPPGSPARRRLMRVACRVARLEAPAWRPDGTQQRAVELAERYAAGDDSISLVALSDAGDLAFIVNRTTSYSAACETCFMSAGDWDYSVARCAHYAASAAGPDGRLAVFARSAEIIREEYPDIAAALTELQAVRGGGGS